MEMTEYAPGTPSRVDVSSPDVAVAAEFYSQLPRVAPRCPTTPARRRAPPTG